MPSILVVEKTGVIKETTTKSFSQSDLYKKAGFKNGDDFKMVHNWTMEINGKSTTISLFGKTNGRAGQENKYDFPPPVDTVLFFGACILVADISNDGSSCGNLTNDKWEEIYEALFGGFEDLGDEDSEMSVDDEDSDVPRTKNGYVKDGFVVDDDEDEYETEEDEDEYETEEEEPLPKKTKTQKKLKTAPKTSASKKKTTLFDKIDTDDENTFLDCSSELVEEEYE